MRVAVFLAWCAGWWSLPAVALYVGGKAVNFIVMLGLVAAAATLAGYFYLWPTRRWLDQEAECRLRDANCQDAGDRLAIPAATTALVLLAVSVLVFEYTGARVAAIWLVAVAALLTLLPYAAEWLRRLLRSLPWMR